MVYFAYVSPEGSSIYDTGEQNGILLLENNIIEIRSEYQDCLLFLAGDFNSRTTNCLDFIPNDNLDFVLGDVDYDSDNFELRRNNLDYVRYNNYGKTLVELCCCNNMHIVNGRLHDDVRGNFTCINHNGASVVDNNIASRDLFPYISQFGIENRDVSIHFPLNCQFKFPSNHVINQNINLYENMRPNVKI